MSKCSWARNHPLEEHYHDTQWGVPVHEYRLLFEMLILEGAQAGLSWLTVLKKREAYCKAFDNFDVHKVAGYSEEKQRQLLSNPDIIRNKLKIRSSITNAQAFIAIQAQYGSFDAYIWSFVNAKTIDNVWRKMHEIPTSSPESELMSKSLKKAGFKFVGPTSCYAYMQAVGMVNDHLLSCPRYYAV